MPLHFDRAEYDCHLPKLLSVDEIELLISSAGDTKNSTRLRAMLELVYASGLRVSELCELPMTANLGDKLLIHGKGAKERIVPVLPAVYDAIEKLQNQPLSNDDMTALQNYINRTYGNLNSEKIFRNVLWLHIINVFT